MPFHDQEGGGNQQHYSSEPDSYYETSLPTQQYHPPNKKTNHKNIDIRERSHNKEDKDQKASSCAAAAAASTGACPSPFMASSQYYSRINSNGDLSTVSYLSQETTAGISSASTAASSTFTSTSTSSTTTNTTVYNNSSNNNNKDNSSRSTIVSHVSLSRSKPSMNFFPSSSSSSHSSTTHYNSGHNDPSSSGVSVMRRSNSRSVFSDAEMSHAQSQTLTLTKFFGHDMNRYTNKSPEVPIFDSALRNFMEPHISKARKAREEQRRLVLQDKLGIDAQIVENLSIASNAFVPYPALRTERPFLFDVETYPLHQILADTLGVSDLSLLHEHRIQDKRALLSPLLDEKKRRAFHQCYDNFVQTFCIPLLHSLAISQKMFHDVVRSSPHHAHCYPSSSHHHHQHPHAPYPSSEKICYRYQSFPCLRVIRPDEFSIGPHCDMAYGHSIGNINFHIPLTPTFGTNCVYTESHPGREDWHPLKTKAVGLGYVFDGARCLHFTLENTTPSTRVSLDFRIAIYRDYGGGGGGEVMSPAEAMMQHSISSSYSLSRDEESHRHVPHRRLSSAVDYDSHLHDCLCHPKILQDNYSAFPGYYEEAFIDMGYGGVSGGTLPGPVAQKKNKTLMRPDKRVGFPF